MKKTHCKCGNKLYYDVKRCAKCQKEYIKKKLTPEELTDTEIMVDKWMASPLLKLAIIRWKKLKIAKRLTTSNPIKYKKIFLSLIGTMSKIIELASKGGNNYEEQTNKKEMLDFYCERNKNVREI
jgi:hypothetical protein